VKFFFAESELSGNDCNGLNVCRGTGSGWQALSLWTAWGSDV
jgi:hypothetical protein